MSVKGSTTTSTYIEWEIALDAVEKLEFEHNYTYALLIGLGIYTGLRIGDILHLRWKDIYAKQEFNIIEQKTKKRRLIPVNKHLYLLINRAYGAMNPWDDDYYVFRQTFNYKRPIMRTTVNIALKKIFAPYDINGNISTHSLRKTFGRRIWENNGKSAEALIMLMEVFNHSSVMMTKRYLGIRQAELSVLYLKM